jgi:4-alpha-glucanotransferase
VTGRPALVRLAEEMGIIPRYLEQTGKVWRETTDETREALLTAMGFDVSSEARAREAVEHLATESRGRPVEPVRVVQQADARSREALVSVPDSAGEIEWEAELELEGGEMHRLSGARTASGGSTLRIELPLIPPLGYHTLRVHLTQGAESRTADQSLIVVPSACMRPRDLLGRQKAFGLVANLYTLVSVRNWGVGDVTDLQELGEWAATFGAEFIGVNPLHALLNRGGDVSPYSPVTRQFRNPIYIDVDRIPRHRGGTAAHDEDRLRRELEELRAARAVDYERIMALKWERFRALHRDFLDHAPQEALADYREWCAAREPELTRYATWMLIALGDGERVAAAGPDWRQWPATLRRAGSREVADFEAGHLQAIDLHRWVQYELDRQIGEVAESLEAAGLRIGLYQDLAIGTSVAGSDVWSDPQLFVQGVSVGAPPDPYSATGQNWGLPPIDPRRLRGERYRYWISLLRAAFRHAGALRIDHVLGLFRLFWIPDGMSGDKGAYVRYPTEELLGILALESVRHRALVVGEDLGTVPPEVAPTLRRWSVLSSKVMLFEREEDGSFRGSEAYEEQSLATANTHDMPPLEAFWRGLEIPDRVKFGFVPPEQEAETRKTRETDRRQLVKLLRDERVLPQDVEVGVTDGATVRRAVHDFLALTPATLVGVSLDDLAGETEPVNIPGTTPEQRPNWTRRMSRSMEEIRGSADTRASLGRRLGEERC